MANTPRLGRPPASNSSETRARILDVARRLFATNGYGATSNRALAEEASLTTGAIYHYFESKLDIYTAVYDETQNVVFSRLKAVTADSTSFIESLKAVLEASHDLRNEDPSLPLFLGSCRVDAARDPILADAIRGVKSTDQRKLFARLVALGVKTGEIDPAESDNVLTLVHTLTTGLTDGASGNRQQHRQAIDAALALFEGKLIRPPVV